MTKTGGPLPRSLYGVFSNRIFDRGNGNKDYKSNFGRLTCTCSETFLTDVVVTKVTRQRALI